MILAFVQHRVELLGQKQSNSLVGLCDSEAPSTKVGRSEDLLRRSQNRLFGINDNLVNIAGRAQVEGSFGAVRQHLA